MSKVYTFPTLALPSGAVVIQITTSTGSGSETLTEKYFSSDIIVTDETEYFGGELQSPYLDLSVDYDYNNLFFGTILPAALTVGEHVRVKLTIGGKVRFLGSIAPETIRTTAFHADNDSLDNVKNGVSFRCIWLLQLLKAVTIDDLEAKLLTDTSYYASVDSYEWISFRQLARLCLDVFSETYGYSYSLSWNSSPLRFLSNDSIGQFTQYNYPGDTIVGNIDNGSFDSDAFCPGIIFRAQNVLVDYFRFDSPYYLENAYTAFVQILKSFGFYASVSYSSSTDITIVIGERSSGSPMVLRDTISHEEIPFAELSRSGVDIRSKTSGNEYSERFYDSMGDSQYTDTVWYDFHNDNDFPGGDINSRRSICMPYGNSDFLLMRDSGVGGNRITNGNFTTDLSGWTVVSGTWTWSSYDIGSGKGAGSARVTLDNTSEQELRYDLGETFNDHSIISFRVAGNINVPVEITLRYQLEIGGSVYDYSQTWSTSVLIFGSRLVYHVNRSNLGFRYVSIVVRSPSNYGAQYLYFDGVSLQRNRRGTPELVGRKVKDFFVNKMLTRKQITVDGIMDTIAPMDYITIGGANYYLKKVKYDFFKNETEIEAINYPY